MATASDLQVLLENRVPTGSVTTYGDLSAYFYDGSRGNGQAIGTMLGVCARNQPDLTHRVVLEDGALAPARPGGPALQREQLEAEGVPFTPQGRVDLHVCRVDVAALGAIG